VPTALMTYPVVMAFHIMAVFLAYGLPAAYPLLIPYVRRRHPEAMPGVHDVQYRLNVVLTGPGTALVFVLGAYMASRHHLWGEPWVQVPLAMLVLIGAIGGAVIVPASRGMIALASADIAAAGGGKVTWSAAYERVYRRYMAAEITLGAAVLVAIFFMAAKPFA
jgi:hypothetical protein